MLGILINKINLIINHFLHKNMENYSDYDKQQQILVVAVMLSISIDNRTEDDIIDDLQSKYPDIADLILVRTYQKDRLKFNLDNSNRVVTYFNGNIEVSGDQYLNKFFMNDVFLSEEIKIEIDKYNQKAAQP